MLKIWLENSFYDKQTDTVEKPTKFRFETNQSTKLMAKFPERFAPPCTAGFSILLRSFFPLFSSNLVNSFPNGPAQVVTLQCSFFTCPSCWGQLLLHYIFKCSYWPLVVCFQYTKVLFELSFKISLPFSCHLMYKIVILWLL